MSTSITAEQMLDREYLEVRCRLLDIAAALDRIDRSNGASAVTSDTRLAAVRDALGVLADGRSDRARRVQMIFSDAYDDAWRGR